MGAADFSSKIDPDVKERLGRLIEDSKLTNKDFMTRLVECYEANQARESLGQVKEIEQLSHHLSRVQEIYISMVKAAQDRQEADAARISKAENDALAAKAEAHEREKEAAQAIESADQRVQDAQTLLAQVREQTGRELAEMRESLDREKEAREQSARLANLAEQAAATAKEKAEALEAEAQKSEQYRQERDRIARELERQKDELNRQEVQYKKALEQAEAQHQDILARTQERAEVEKERAVLAAQRECMEQIGSLREALAQCREEKAALEIKCSQLEKQKK